MKPERKPRSPRAQRLREVRDRQAREIERLKHENERLREQLEEQAKRIADLERQLALRQQKFHHHLETALIGWPRRSTTCAWSAREESTQGRWSAGASRAPP